MPNFDTDAVRRLEQERRRGNRGDGNGKYSPAQKPGRSKQDYRTPPEFLDAVKRMLGIDQFLLDLAATADNAVADRFISPEQDSLSVDTIWPETNVREWCWLNPPFAYLSPWVERAYCDAGWCNTAMLVPAGVGSNWWRDWVHLKADVLFLNGRISFDGVAPYPKDCALLLYEKGSQGTYTVWDWRKQ